MTGRAKRDMRELLAEYRRHASVEGALAHAAASLGTDFAHYGMDEPIKAVSTLMRNGTSTKKPSNRIRSTTCPKPSTRSGMPPDCRQNTRRATCAGQEWTRLGTLARLMTSCGRCPVTRIGTWCMCTSNQIGVRRQMRSPSGERIGVRRGQVSERTEAGGDAAWSDRHSRVPSQSGELDELRVGRTLVIGRFVARHHRKQGLNRRDRVQIPEEATGSRSRRRQISFGLGP